MKVLLVGASGLLGSYLRKSKPDDIALCSTYNKNSLSVGVQLDTTKVLDVLRLVKRLRPDVIIHTAAMGSVDDSEKDPLRSLQVNVYGAIATAEAAVSIGAKFVHISSNAVFGAFPPPYTETSAFSPVNVYGRQKSAVDDALSGIPGVLIIRPILMYGWPEAGRGNWVTVCLDRWGKNQAVKAATDVLTQPLYAGDCASFIWKAVENNLTGVYHIAGKDVMTVYQFSECISTVFSLGGALLAKALISDFPSLAPRPSACWFVLDKAEAVGYKSNGVQEGLTAMRNERLKNVTC